MLGLIGYLGSPLVLCGRVLERKGQGVAPWLQFLGSGQGCLRDDQLLGSTPEYGPVEFRMSVTECSYCFWPWRPGNHIGR